MADIMLLWHYQCGRRVHSLPSSGGDFMQYVTYENLFTFALVIIGLVTVFVAVLAYNKEITALS